MADTWIKSNSHSLGTFVILTAVGNHNFDSNNLVLKF